MAPTNKHKILQTNNNYYAYTGGCGLAIFSYKSRRVPCPNVIHTVCGKQNLSVHKLNENALNIIIYVRKVYFALLIAQLNRLGGV